MGKGQSFGGGLMLKTESSFGTAADLSSGATSLPIAAETIAVEHPHHIQANIAKSRVQQRATPGVLAIQGGFTMEADAINLGLPLFYWNGQVSSAALPSLTAAPTGSASAGGSLTAGAYRFKVAAVWQNDADTTVRWFANASSSSNQITTATTDLTVNLTWSDPTALTAPDGWSYYGTAIYRTAAAGAAGTEKFVKIVTGSGTTGSVADTTLDTTVSPPDGTVYQHIFIPEAVSAATHPLDAFSAGVLKDNDESETYYGGRMNTFSLSLGDGNAPVEASFEAMFQRVQTGTNISPSPSQTAPMMNWAAWVSIDGGSKSTLVEAVEITGTNNLEAVPHLAGVNYVREFYPGMRAVSGTLTMAFENHDMWDKMKAGTEFSLEIYLQGTTTTADSDVTVSSVNYQAWPYSMRVALWKCYMTGGGANLSGSDRLVASFPFVAVYDSNEGEEMEIRLYNKTASYS